MLDSDRIRRFTNFPLSYTQIFFAVLGITSVRVIIDWSLLQYPIQLDVFQDYVRFYLENVYYFLIVFLVGAVFTAKITNLKLPEVMRFGVYLYPIIILPPLIDVGLFGATEGYYYATAGNFLWNFLTLSFLKGDATLGISVEILIGLTGMSAYVWWKTKKVYKAIVTFLFLDLLLVIISTPDLFFGNFRGDYYFDDFLPFYYFFPFLILSGLALFLYNRNKLTAILKNTRVVRSAVFILAVLLGGILSHRVTHHIYGFNLFLGTCAVYLVWQVSVIINDISDRDIDRLTNPSRPLIQGTLTVDEYSLTAILLAFSALSFAIVINLKVFFLTLGTVFLALIYSLPPVRIKKSLWGNALIGVSLWLSFFMGFFSSRIPYAPQDIPVTDKILLFSLLIFAFGTVISLVKDIKDIEGDKANGIRNLYTVYGKEKGKRITTLLIFLTLNIPTVISAHIIVFLLSCAAAFLYYKFESIKGVYIIGMIVILMTLF